MKCRDRKKNKIIDQARALAAFHARAIRYEQELKQGFVKEGITSTRTYERRYKKGNYSECGDWTTGTST